MWVVFTTITGIAKVIFFTLCVCVRVCVYVCVCVDAYSGTTGYEAAH